MTISPGTFEEFIAYFTLVLMRVSMMFVASPIFSRKNIPNFAKIILSLMLAHIVVLSVSPPPLPSHVTIVSYGIICLLEAIVGLAIGYITVLAFSVTMTAGQIIDVQMGFSMSQMYDPVSGAQVPITGSFLNYILVAMFFIANGHHRLIEILCGSFRLIPVANYSLNPSVAWIVADVFARIFLLGIQLGMPILITSLLIEVVLGIIVRNVPQMNMFVVGIPLKLIVGLGLLLITLPLFIKGSGRIFDFMFTGLDNLVSSLAIVL